MPNRGCFARRQKIDRLIRFYAYKATVKARISNSASSFLPSGVW